VGSVRFVCQHAKEGRAGLGPVGPWVGRYRGALRIGIVALGPVVLFAWSNPGLWVVLGVILGVLLLLWAVEAIGRGYPSPEADGDEPASKASEQAGTGRTGSSPPIAGRGVP